METSNSGKPLLDYARKQCRTTQSVQAHQNYAKSRSTLTDGEQKAQMREWSPETDNAELHIPAIPYGNRNLMVENSQGHSSSNSVQPPLLTLYLPESENFSENKEENSQLAGSLCTSGTILENALNAPNAPVQCKSTRENFGKPAKKYSDHPYL